MRIGLFAGFPGLETETKMGWSKTAIVRSFLRDIFGIYRVDYRLRPKRYYVASCSASRPVARILHVKGHKLFVGGQCAQWRHGREVGDNCPQLPLKF